MKTLELNSDDKCPRNVKTEVAGESCKACRHCEAVNIWWDTGYRSVKHSVKCSFSMSEKKIT